MAAITRSKLEVLELAGTYLESLSVVENAILTKDEVTALAGGVLTTEVVKRKNYATDKTFGILDSLGHYQKSRGSSRWKVIVSSTPRCPFLEKKTDMRYQ